MFGFYENAAAFPREGSLPNGRDEGSASADARIEPDRRLCRSRIW